MRSFALINAQNRRWDLNSFQSFFYDIKGFGIDYKNKYIRYGNIYDYESHILSQKNIQGKVNFKSYSIYKDFVLFIQQTPLMLEYTAADKVYINVSIEKLGKTELQTGGLHCDLTMKSLSNFYKKITKTSGNINVGKVYPVTYPYTYSDSKYGYVEIESDSLIESGMKIILNGPLTNPTYTVQRNNIFIGKGIINSSIDSNHNLIIDTTKVPYEIAEYDSSLEFVQSLYKYSDFSTKRFMNIGYGTNRISAMHEGNEDIHMTVEAFIEYESI